MSSNTWNSWYAEEHLKETENVSTGYMGTAVLCKFSGRANNYLKTQNSEKNTLSKYHSMVILF